ncbi:O-succinylbenzoate synthase [Gemmatimonas aurantiaca T-27]|uniref:o-succinylbenzoate synthase n=1 Tax=Gemmatimonas aurantiaca (strain DSM 14586 / JCM 11422 / NBRC 100505 / T-27) TaxID=379066 RepID=C1A995_GEMAT|nr:o-succinylbenzoate synthase [Gemmatimonas aurantiaca]BAH39072.1 O-succinylbenzoate synthase [Gemmatimonas aurantiaca T-27]
MIRLEQITLREIRLPLREPFRISSGEVTERRITLLELRDVDGVTVWSEGVAGELPNYSPEAIDTAWIAITNWVAPRVLGREFAHPRDVFPALEADFRGNMMAKAAVEMGLWVLEAQRRGVPLASLLGGTRDAIATGISLGIQSSPERLVAKAQAAIAEGYRKVKIKIAPGQDIAYVRAAREALPDAPLMADANNAYTLDDLDLLAELDAFDLMMIEQPLAWDDLVQHATLQQRLRTPVCLDESITSLDRARDMVTLGAGRIVNIKPGRVGGFASSLAIHDYCFAQGIPVWCGGMLESGVGRACNVALASLPGFTKPGDLSPSARYWSQDVVTPEWTMTNDGMVPVPLHAPGLGVSVDVDRIDNLTVRRVVLH